LIKNIYFLSSPCSPGAARRAAPGEQGPLAGPTGTRGTSYVYFIYNWLLFIRLSWYTPLPLLSLA